MAPRNGWRFGLAVKLAASLVVSTAALFVLFGWLNLRLQRRHAEEIVLQSAERISDLILRSTHYQMLRNDREALYHVITTLGSEPGIRRIRLFNEEGRARIGAHPEPSALRRLRLRHGPLPRCGMDRRERRRALPPMPLPRLRRTLELRRSSKCGPVGLDSLSDANSPHELRRR